MNNEIKGNAKAEKRHKDASKIKISENVKKMADEIIKNGKLKNKSKVKEKKILDFNIEDFGFEERCSALYSSFAKMYNGNFNFNESQINGVNVLLKEMNIRSKKFEKSSNIGLRIFLIKNQNYYTIGEYNNKISLNIIQKKIKEFNS